MAHATDPVCNREVDTGTPFKSRYRGKTFYFCSAKDRAAFKRNPAKYAAPEPVACIIGKK
jgi:YHS domain-containing protein